MFKATVITTDKDYRKNANPGTEQKVNKRTKGEHCPLYYNDTLSDFFTKILRINLMINKGMYPNSIISGNVMLYSPL